MISLRQNTSSAGRLIERYVIKTVIAAIMLVLLMLTGLQGFILFVNQLGDLGKGNYGIAQALYFIGLNIPYQVYLFFPMASLLGCLVGLGVLANHHELVVMRAAGMSIGQMTLAIFKGAAMLILTMTLLGEMVFPKMVLWANAHKMQAIGRGQTLKTSQGLWFRSYHDIITVASVLMPLQLLAVEQFHFDDDNQLVFVRHIDRVTNEQWHWIAHNVSQTTLNGLKVATTQQAKRAWDVNLDPRMLLISHNEPDEMTFSELSRYLSAQKQSHQNVRNYQLVYWQRIVLPFTTVVMMLLAIPFVFGPLRSSSMGSKLIVGAVVGFGFYILNRFCGSLSQIYQFPALLAAVGPTLLCAMLGAYLMQR